MISVTVSVFSNAQSNKEDVELVQAMYGKEKMALVTESITITDEARKPRSGSYTMSTNQNENHLARKELNCWKNMRMHTVRSTTKQPMR